MGRIAEARQGGKRSNPSSVPSTGIDTPSATEHHAMPGSTVARARAPSRRFRRIVASLHARWHAIVSAAASGFQLEVRPTVRHRRAIPDSLAKRTAGVAPNGEQVGATEILLPAVFQCDARIPRTVCGRAALHPTRAGALPAKADPASVSALELADRGRTRARLGAAPNARRSSAESRIPGSKCRGVASPPIAACALQHAHLAAEHTRIRPAAAEAAPRAAAVFTSVCRWCERTRPLLAAELTVRAVLSLVATALLFFLTVACFALRRAASGMAIEAADLASQVAFRATAVDAAGLRPRGEEDGRGGGAGGGRRNRRGRSSWSADVMRTE